MPARPSSRKPIWFLSASVVITSVTLASIIPTSAPVALPDLKPEPGYLATAFNPGAPLNVGIRTLEAYERDFSLLPMVDVDDAAATLTPLKIGSRGLFRSEEISRAIQTLVDSSATSLRNVTLLSSSTSSDEELRITYKTGTIERSEDGKRVDRSDPILLKLSEIFGWDIDFALDLREGDTYLAVFEEKYRRGRRVSEGNIVAAEFVNRGKVYRAIGFPTHDGKVAYFSPSGKSLRRTFLRTPVQFTSVSSPFSKARYHPILKMWRAHNGVDYAAAAGTPVLSTASGEVISIGWNGGYGNTVVIKHKGPYSTLYAHLSRYRQDLEVGDHIEQGEVIGYVGQTGLATGPHLHYEFQVNGEHRNPLTLEMQEDGETIMPMLREEFFRVARTWTARLDLLSGRHVAVR